MTKDSETRIKAALHGPSGEVLRLIAAQPKRPSCNPPDPNLRIPVARGK